MGDNVYIRGSESSALPFNFPFPLFSFSPKIDSMDMPWPWPKSYTAELEKYEIAEKNQNFSDAFYSQHRHHLIPWSDKIPKASFIGTYNTIRHIIYDQAVLRPDLFDARFYNQFGNSDIKSWNPLATADDAYEYNLHNHTNDVKIQTGDASHIMALSSASYISTNPSNYKYIIVIAGLDGEASADRLAELIAHSGSVILLQETSLRYHFSARLTPWVHYVPLAYNTADAIEKIEWLKQHDNKAKRIAQNAYNFGKSYLRYEDYICYVATALKTIESIVNQTDAIIPVTVTRTRTHYLIPKNCLLEKKGSH